MKGELGTRPGRRGGEGKLIADLMRELDEKAQLGEDAAPDTAVLFVLDRRNNATTLERIDADEASEEYLADTWGGGRYQVRLEGGGKYLGSINVRVGGAPGAAARHLAQSSGEEAGAPADDPTRELKTQLDRLHQELAQLRRPVDAAPPMQTPVEMMRMASEMAMAMVKPMQTMMETLAKQKPAAGGGSEVSMFLKGLRAGRELADGDGGGGFGPVLMKAFDRLEGLQLMGAGNPPGAPPSNLAQEPQVTAEPAHPYLPAIAPYADQLLQVAGSSPGLWADVIEDRAPDLVDALRGATDASRTQLLNALVAYRPALAPHRPWLDLLVGELVAPNSEESPDVRDPVD